MPADCSSVLTSKEWCVLVESTHYRQAEISSGCILKLVLLKNTQL